MSNETSPEKEGRVYLVGAGPGAPDLLTIRALEILKRTEVLLYDRLVSEEILAHVPATAERIYAGKDRGDSSPVRQSRVIEDMVREARKGKLVVRLKGGDPFVFGRGGEEALALKEAGIACEVVPGISAAVAAAELAWIPVTHRGISSSFGVFAGHEASPENITGIDWSAAAAIHTSVYLMALGRLPLIVSRLLENGKDPATPVAVVERATQPEMRIVTGTLVDIVEKITAAGLKPPSAVIVGDVVNLREKLVSL